MLKGRWLAQVWDVIEGNLNHWDRRFPVVGRGKEGDRGHFPFLLSSSSISYPFLWPGLFPFGLQGTEWVSEERGSSTGRISLMSLCISCPFHSAGWGESIICGTTGFNPEWQHLLFTKSKFCANSLANSQFYLKHWQIHMQTFSTCYTVPLSHEKFLNLKQLAKH